MSIDLSGVVGDLVAKSLARADLYFKNGSPSISGHEYARAAELMTKYADYALNNQLRGERLKKAQEYRDISVKLMRGDLMLTTVGDSVSGIGNEGVPLEITKLIHVSKITWDDIGGLEETKKNIKYAYGLALARVKAGVKLPNWGSILFYGPPGTGKTLLAAAASNGLEAVFFNIKTSSVLSKYFGESSKIFSSLYEAARKASPAVVFIDEFESLTPQRGEANENGAERRLLSTVLSELDGLAEKGQDRGRFVLTIAATNAPWLMDEAVLSRFQKKIFIPLPDENARRGIFRIHLEKKGFDLRGVGCDVLASRTKGFSGREIERFCKLAVERMVSQMNGEIPQMVEKGKEAITGYEIKIRPLSLEDFENVLTGIVPATKEKPMRAFEEWTRNVPRN